LCGISSRRNAEKIIEDGRVMVDGIKITFPGTKIDETNSKILLDNKRTKFEKKIYIMLNKPVGYISTVRDEKNRPTIMNLTSEIKTRIYPIGRLDCTTEGLILMTNDGEITNKLTHPRYSIEKTYIAEVSGNLNPIALTKLRKGIVINNYKTKSAKINIIGNSKYGIKLEITLREGKKHQIKDMFEMVNCKLNKLKRISESEIFLGNLPIGKWRKLNDSEISKLKATKRKNDD
jgi:pseudouridine synthase